MLKHVHITTSRSSCSTPVGARYRGDTLSLNSSFSYSSISPETPLSSRSSSYTSLSDSSNSQGPATSTRLATIKVYARCLRPDIEYKTLSITTNTTCKELILLLLNKYKMKHRDPNLFYLTMEVGIRKRGIPLRTIMVLDDEACPIELQSCHPRGDSKFTLQMRRGGLVKIYDSVLMSGSQYKSLLLSERTTVDESIQLVLNCYNYNERATKFSLYELCFNKKCERKLHPDDHPLQVTQEWANPENYALVLKRNPDPPPRRKLPCYYGMDQSFSGLDRSLRPLTISSAYNDYENYFYI